MDSWRNYLASSQIGRTFSYFILLFFQNHVWTCLFSSCFHMSFSIFIAVNAIDRASWLKWRTIRKSLGFVFFDFFPALIELSPQSHILLIQWLKFLMKRPKIGFVCILPKLLKLLVQLYLFQLCLIDLFADIFVALFSCTFLLAKVELILGNRKVFRLLLGSVLNYVATIEEIA